MGEKTAGVGHFMIPTSPLVGIACAQSATANTFGTLTQIILSTSAALYITGIYIELATAANLPTYVSYEIAVTASTIVDTGNVPFGPSSGVTATQAAVYKPINPWIPVAASTKILATTASSVASALAWNVTLECILQTNVVDDGVSQSSNVTQLLGTAWLTPGTAGTPDVNAKLHGGTAQTGRDIGTSVLLSTGAGTGQLDFTSGVVKANLTQVLAGAVPATTITGVPKVDIQDILGTAISTPATAGILDVNVKNVVNAAAALDANNLLKVDVEAWKAGIVPAVTVTGVPKVDVQNWTGTAVATPDTAGVPIVNLKYILGTILTETSGQIAAAFKKFFNIATPASTMDALTLVTTATTLTNAPADSTTLTEINADVDEMIVTLGAAGAGLTAIPVIGHVTLVDTATTLTNAPADSTALTEIGADVDELITTVGVAGIGLTAIPVIGHVTLVDTVTTLTNAPSDSVTVTEINADVDELIATIGVAGAGLSAIPGSGDPWSTALPGAYGAGTAGLIVGTTLTEGATDVDELITTVGAAGAGLTALGDTRIANLDATVSTRSTYSGGAVASVTGNVVGAVGSVTGGVTVTTNNDKAGYALTIAERTAIGDSMMDETAGVETGLTVRQAFRLFAAVLLGKVSGAATNLPIFRNTQDTKNRVSATTDSSGNRISITLDGS